MKILALIGIFGVLLFVFGMFWFGVFAPVKVVEKQAGPYLLVYKKHVGDYKNAGTVMDEVYYDLRDNFGLDTTKGIGLYYDNPQETDVAQLRSILGVIVEGKSEADLAEIAQKYGVATFPQSKSIMVEFPNKGQMSIMVGVFKVYPKINAYIAEKAYPVTPMFEIYDQPNQTTTYLAPYNVPPAVFEALLK